jgi:hypothetical protein
MEEISTYEQVFNDIQAQGAGQAERLETKSKRENMKHKMTDLANRWKNVSKAMADRRKEMDRLLPVVVCYVQTRNELLSWLTADERRLNELALDGVISDIDSLANKKQVIKELRLELENHRPVFQNLVSTSGELISICHELNINTDAVVVIGDVEENKRRWERHNAAVLGGEKLLRNSDKTMAQLREVMAPMQQAMNTAESILAQEPAYGTDISQVKKELTKVVKVIDVLEDSEYKLVRLSKQVTNNEYIITIIKDNRVMQVRLKERKVKLEKYIKTVEVFEGASQEVETKVMGIMRFVTVEIVMTDIDEIRDQLQHVQNLEEEVVIHRRKIETMEETGEWIIKQNNNKEEVISEVKSSISRAQSSIDEVSVKLLDRRRRLETALTETERVNETLTHFEKRIVVLDKKMLKAKPVSAEFGVLKDQRTNHEVNLMIKASTKIVE